jgi:hypothetical protein
MSNFAHCPTPDNDDEEDEVQEEEAAATEDPFLSLTGTEEQYASSRSINVCPSHSACVYVSC